MYPPTPAHFHHLDIHMSSSSPEPEPSHEVDEVVTAGENVRHVVIPVYEHTVVVIVHKDTLTSPLQTRVPAIAYVQRLAKEWDNLEREGKWTTLAEQILSYSRWPTMLMLVHTEWGRLKRNRRRRSLYTQVGTPDGAADRQAKLRKWIQGLPS